MMKTKEFIKRVEKLGFDIEYSKNPFSNVSSNCDYDLITIYLYDRVLVKIWANCQYAISTVSDGHSDYLYGYDVEELYKLCFEYTSTSVEDREEEKKFYLKHRWLNNENTNYLRLNEENNFYDLSVYKSLDAWKAQLQFTEKEIEEIKQKFDTDLSDFEIIEEGK